MKNIRNFSIIAHIDHGKTTLTDRLLQATHTISQHHFRPRLLDSNPIEQEKGITIKLAPVRMTYTPPQPLFGYSSFFLNLIDTPGHVDFSYEVDRSLAACEGALLVVDATQGVQAQTYANFQKAHQHNLTIIPVVNKIDLPSAQPQHVAQELSNAFGFSPQDILFVSAKTGQNIPQLLESIVRRLPPPSSPSSDVLKALVFNSVYDPHKGVIAFIKIISGHLQTDNLQSLFLLQTKIPLQATEIGFFSPYLTPTKSLSAGQVGYLATGLKDIKLIAIGDTLTDTTHSSLTPIPGFSPPQPMVYMDMYPLEADDFPRLRDSLTTLSLSDASLSFSPTHSLALGSGFRVGFLGILHAEIITERLLREFDVSVLNTTPSVTYHLLLNNGQFLSCSSPADFPKPEKIAVIEEPFIALTIYTPKQYLGDILSLMETTRSQFKDMQYLDENKLYLEYELPLAEFITGFYARLKSVSSGYASLEYRFLDYRPSKLVKVSLLINKKPLEALSFLTHPSSSYQKARQLVDKLKTLIPRQQVEVAIQAAINNKVIARATIKPFRKDVTAKLYGGDRTRRMKLLAKQKQGKKRMKQFANINIPQEVFTKVLTQ